MKKYHSLIIMAAGILFIVAGVGYGVFFAGLPGPDDSPAEMARVSLHGNIAFGGVCVGVLSILVGMVVGAFRLFARKQQPRA